MEWGFLRLWFLAWHMRQKQKDAEAEISYRGVYVFKVDASATVLPPAAPPTPERTARAPFGLGYPWSPPAGSLPPPERQWPKLTSTAMNSSVSGSLTEKDTWTAGGGL